MNLIYTTDKLILYILIAYYGDWVWITFTPGDLCDMLRVLLSMAINNRLISFLVG